MSFAVLTGALTVAGWITHRSTSIFPLAIAIFLFIVWWRDIIREAFGGYHFIAAQGNFSYLGGRGMADTMAVRRVAALDDS